MGEVTISFCSCGGILAASLSIGILAAFWISASFATTSENDIVANAARATRLVARLYRSVFPRSSCWPDDAAADHLIFQTDLPAPQRQPRGPGSTGRVMSLSSKTPIKKTGLFDGFVVPKLRAEVRPLPPERPSTQWNVRSDVELVGRARWERLPGVVPNRA